MKIQFKDFVNLFVLIGLFLILNIFYIQITRAEEYEVTRVGDGWNLVNIVEVNGKPEFRSDLTYNGKNFSDMSGTEKFEFLKYYIPDGKSDWVFTDKFIYFPAETVKFGNELWKMDEKGNISLVKDICPNSCTSFSTSLFAFNNELYFRASDGDDSNVWSGVWKIDNNGKLTKFARNVKYGVRIFEYNSKIYFVEYDRKDEKWWSSISKLDKDNNLVKIFETPAQLIIPMKLEGDLLYFRILGNFSIDDEIKDSVYLINLATEQAHVLGQQGSKFAEEIGGQIYFMNSDDQLMHLNTQNQEILPVHNLDTNEIVTVNGLIDEIDGGKDGLFIQTREYATDFGETRYHVYKILPNNKLKKFFSIQTNCDEVSSCIEGDFLLESKMKVIDNKLIFHVNETDDFNSDLDGKTAELYIDDFNSDLDGKTAELYIDDFNSDLGGKSAELYVYNLANNTINSIHHFDEVRNDGSFLVDTYFQYNCNIYMNYMGIYKLTIKKQFSDLNCGSMDKYVESLYDKGVIEASEDGLFMPDKFVTKEEFVKLISDALDISEDEIVEFIGEQPASDKSITRAEAAEIITKILSKGEIPTDKQKIYSDVAVEDDLNEYITFVSTEASGVRIMNGFGDGTFRPNEKLTKIQAAKIVDLAT